MLPADFKLADQFLWHVWQYGVTLQAATSQVCIIHAIFSSVCKCLSVCRLLVHLSVLSVYFFRFERRDIRLHNHCLDLLLKQ